MKNIIVPAFFTLVALMFFAIFSGCAKKTADNRNSIAVFVPGIMSGSPVYEMLAEGVLEAVNDFNASLPDTPAKFTVVEAGTNQAEWSGKLTALAASGEYGVIISSNPSLPEIIEPISIKFPEQKFIVLDAFAQGNKNIAALRYNQREQAYVTGYMAALVSGSSMKYANAAKKIGLIAAQEYPVMNNILLPSFIEGAKAADSAVTVDFRLVGNWFDASKGADLARLMYDSGVDVILPIAGGASQGVIASAKDLGFYVTWFDDNGFAKAPNYVVSSSVMRQKKAAYEMTKDFLQGETKFGAAKTVGMKDGYLTFITDDPLYIQTVPVSIREKMQKLIDSITDGTLELPSS